MESNRRGRENHEGGYSRKTEDSDHHKGREGWRFSGIPPRYARLGSSLLLQKRFNKHPGEPFREMDRNAALSHNRPGIETQTGRL